MATPIIWLMVTGRNNFRFFQASLGRLAWLLTILCLSANLLAPRAVGHDGPHQAFESPKQAPQSLRQACAKVEAVEPRTEVDPPLALAAEATRTLVAPSTVSPAGRAARDGAQPLAWRAPRAHAAQGPPSASSPA
jgi:hypothetical protein